MSMWEEKASINKYILLICIVALTDVGNNLEIHATFVLIQLLIKKHRKFEASYSHIQYD